MTDPQPEPGKAEAAPSTESGGSGREPVFLLPGVIVGLLALLWGVHLAQMLVPGLQLRLWEWFGFIPFRYTDPALVPGGVLPAVWTPFTHALLHADWTHLIFNSVWLAIFGTPVARRYGAVPVLIVFWLGAAAGALAMLASMLAAAVQFTVLVGASGGVSALTGAAVRFVFQPLVVGTDPETGRRVALGRRTASLGEVMANRSSRAFTIIWIGLNLAVPLAPLFMGGAILPIAWQAHIGGFVLGLLAPSLFDAKGRARAQR